MPGPLHTKTRRTCVCLSYFFDPLLQLFLFRFLVSSAFDQHCCPRSVRIAQCRRVCSLERKGTRVKERLLERKRGGIFVFIFGASLLT